MEPNVLWVATSPGVMELPTTKFRITYSREHGHFVLSWNGGGDLAYAMLEEAKERATRWMADLIEMGIEV